MTCRTQRFMFYSLEFANQKHFLSNIMTSYKHLVFIFITFLFIFLQGRDFLILLETCKFFSVFHKKPRRETKEHSLLFQKLEGAPANYGAAAKWPTFWLTSM